MINTELQNTDAIKEEISELSERCANEQKKRIEAEERAKIAEEKLTKISELLDSTQEKIWLMYRLLDQK